MSALQLPNGRNQFINADGAPLVGGQVFFYVPGTTTPKSTWQDQDQTILNDNPIVLDDLGSAAIWGNGSYRQIVYDVLGNLIWDQVISSTGLSASTFMQGFLQADNEFEALLDLGEVYAEAYQLEADGTRILPAIQRAHDALPAVGGVIRIRAGHYTASTDAVTITKPCAIICDAAWEESPTPGAGCWLSITSTAASPFTITGFDATGFMMRGLAFYQTHPAVAPGWTPINYPPVIQFQDTAGGAYLDQLYFANINKWVSSVGAGRTSTGRILGMPLRYGFYIDNALDSCQFSDIHAWPFGYEADPNYGLYVGAWTAANADLFVLGRCDSPMIDRVFALGCRSVLRPVSTASGVCSKLNVNAVIADNCKYLIYDNDTSTGFDCIISKATQQGLKPGISPATVITGTRLIYSTSAQVTIQISEAFCEYHDRYDIESTGANFSLFLGTYRSDLSNQDNGGYGHIKCTGATAIVRVGRFDFQGLPVSTLNDSASTAIIQVAQPLFYAASDAITRYKESYGTATRAIGVTAPTATNVPHGLGATPNYANVAARVNLGASSVAFLWVDGVDATNIVVKANATVAAADVLFFWEAKI